MFVKRTQAGSICAVSPVKTAECTELIDEHSAELQAFVKNAELAALDSHAALSTKQLQHSDADLARVLEDVIDALTMKGIIKFTDLPLAAQEKLLQRKSLRKNLNNLNLISDDDESFMP